MGSEGAGREGVGGSTCDQHGKSAPLLARGGCQWFWVGGGCLVRPSVRPSTKLRTNGLEGWRECGGRMQGEGRRNDWRVACQRGRGRVNDRAGGGKLEGGRIPAALDNDFIEEPGF